MLIVVFPRRRCSQRSEGLRSEWENDADVCMGGLGRARHMMPCYDGL